MRQAKQGGKLRRGLIVIAALAILTAIEYGIALTLPTAPRFAALGLIALVKAWLIIEYFMHFSNLWKSEE